MHRWIGLLLAAVLSAPASLHAQVSAAPEDPAHNELRALRAARCDGNTCPLFTGDTTNHDSPRHAACLQLLAKRVLLLIAISLNSKKIQTIGIRIRFGSFK
jgi:hypothetical protein